MPPMPPMPPPVVELDELFTVLPGPLVVSAGGGTDALLLQAISGATNRGKANPSCARVGPFIWRAPYGNRGGLGRARRRLSGTLREWSVARFSGFSLPRWVSQVAARRTRQPRKCAKTRQGARTTLARMGGRAPAVAPVTAQASASRCSAARAGAALAKAKSSEGERSDPAAMPRTFSPVRREPTRFGQVRGGRRRARRVREASGQLSLTCLLKDLESG